jgi:methylmalonyl-CoA/ethylmalonyl-CoA epimerase
MMAGMRPNLTFDHTGIVVRDIELARESFVGLLPIVGRTRRFDDYFLGVSVQFLQDMSGFVYELIAPLGEDSPVAKVASSRSSVINQVAYRVEDLALAANHLRSQNAIPTGAPKKAIAFGNALVQFFLTREGFIVELIEAPAFNHCFESIDNI